MPGGVPAAALCDVLPPWPTFDQLDEAGFVAEDEHVSVIALGLFLAVMSIVVLLPQLAKILKLRSSAGVSALSLASSAIADVFQLASVAASSSPRFLACESVSAWVCFVGSLPWFQGVLQMMGSSTVLAAFAYFWVWPSPANRGADRTVSLDVSLLPKSAPASEALLTEEPSDEAAPRGQALSLLIVYGCSAAAMLTSTMLPFAVGVCAPLIEHLSTLMAWLSVLLSVVGGIPQIVVLARTCNVGSLSLTSTLLKLVGKIVLAVEFVEEKEPVSAYFPFLASAVTGAVQVSLIILINCRATPK